MAASKLCRDCGYLRPDFALDEKGERCADRVQCARLQERRKRGVPKLDLKAEKNPPKLEDIL